MGTMDIPMCWICWVFQLWEYALWHCWTSIRPREQLRVLLLSCLWATWLFITTPSSSPSRLPSLEGKMLARTQKIQGPSVGCVLVAIFLCHNTDAFSSLAPWCLINKIRRSRPKPHHPGTGGFQTPKMHPVSLWSPRFLVPAAYFHWYLKCTNQICNTPRYSSMAYLFVLTWKTICPFWPVTQLTINCFRGCSSRNSPERNKDPCINFEIPN